MDNGQFNEQSPASCQNTAIGQGSNGIIPYVVDVRHILSVSGSCPSP